MVSAPESESGQRKDNNIVKRFNVKKTWAKELVKTTKRRGANISRAQLAITTDFRFTILTDLTISTRRIPLAGAIL